MLHVNFTKCQCCMSLSLNLSPSPVNLRNTNVPCHYIIKVTVGVAKGYVALLNLRNGHVALLISGV